MPRDNAGNYSLPNGYLATTGQDATATQHNSPLEDIAAAMSASLPVSGAKAMTGPIKVADGSVNAPSVTFNTNQQTGFYKTTNGFGVTVDGVQAVEFTDGLTLKDAGDTVSAAALTLGAGNIFNITGTTAITSIATKGIGTLVWLRFDGALTLTHDATDLILPRAANITTAAGDWALLEEYASGDWRMLAYHRVTGEALARTLPPGFIRGLELSNNADDATNDLDIAAGKVRSSDDTFDIVLTTSITKQLDAIWAAGTDAGMRNSADDIANGTYHIFLVSKADGTTDVYADTQGVEATALTNLQAETGGADYIYALRIGSILRESGAIVAFLQTDDEFFRSASALDLNVTIGITAVLTALSVPTGIKVEALIRASMANASSSFAGLITSPDQSDENPSSTNANFRGAAGGSPPSGNFVIRTDTSGRVRVKTNTSAGTTVVLRTYGWIDQRGRE